MAAPWRLPALVWGLLGVFPAVPAWIAYIIAARIQNRRTHGTQQAWKASPHAVGAPSEGALAQRPGWTPPPAATLLPDSVHTTVDADRRLFDIAACVGLVVLTVLTHAVIDLA
jgi:hypothetical protein